jgi:hypothetical protein
MLSVNRNRARKNSVQSPHTNRSCRRRKQTLAKLDPLKEKIARSISRAADL